MTYVCKCVSIRSFLLYMLFVKKIFTSHHLKDNNIHALPDRHLCQLRVEPRILGAKEKCLILKPQRSASSHYLLSSRAKLLISDFWAKTIGFSTDSTLSFWAVCRRLLKTAILFTEFCKHESFLQVGCFPKRKRTLCLN